MKTLSQYPTTPETPTLTGMPGFIQPREYKPNFPASTSFPAASSQPLDVLTDAAAEAIVGGKIPDLSSVCADLYLALLHAGSSASAVHFIPVLKKLNELEGSGLRRFLKNPEGKYVLVQNALLKVILIRWEPGASTKVHGHPKGGGVFKVLRGSLEEKRYAPGSKTRPLAVSTFKKGSMAYIDDEMAFHAVGNPFKTTAISLHAYFQGIR